MSVVIPTRNRPEYLSRLLASIIGSSYSNLEVLVVDDGSSEANALEVQRATQPFWLIRHEERQGLAAARNAGLQAATGALIFFVDDDNEVDAHAISSLVSRFASSPEFGVIGPVTCYHARPDTLLFVGIKRNMMTGRTEMVGSRASYRDLDLKELIPSEDVPNAFMVRRQVFETVGAFDSDRFPMDYTEAEFGQRVRNAGYRVGIAPEARVFHVSPLEGSEQFMWIRLSSDPYRAFQVGRSKLVFHWKFAGTWRFASFFIAFLPTYVLAHTILILASPTPATDKIRAFHAYLSGVRSALAFMIRSD